MSFLCNTKGDVRKNVRAAFLFHTMKLNGDKCSQAPKMTNKHHKTSWLCTHHQIWHFDTIFDKNTNKKTFSKKLLQCWPVLHTKTPKCWPCTFKYVHVDHVNGIKPGLHLISPYL